MSNLPNPTPPPESSQPNDAPRRPYATLLRIAAGVGIVAVAGGAAIVIAGDRILNTQVLPRVEKAVAETIGRPIEIGEIKLLSWRGIWLVDTTLPPTETDATSASVEQIGIEMDLRSLIFQRELKPEIVLVRPEVNLVQAEDGQWIELALPEPSEEAPPFTLELHSIEVQDARLTASTLIQDPAAVVPRKPIRIDAVNAMTHFRGEDAQRVAFDLTGRVDAGRFEIQGEGDLATRALQTNVRLQDLPVTGVNLFLPSMAGVSAGVLNTNLTAAVALNEANQLDLDAIDLQGTARLRDGEVLISELPTPIRNIQSQLRFQGQRVTLEEAGLQLEDMTLRAAGDVDLQEGYNLTAQIPAIAIADVQRLAGLELPMTADGTFQLDSQVTGELLEPRVRGRLANSDPVQVDQVGLATVVANFALTREQFDLTELRVVPEDGGVVVAQGQADLTDLTDPSFQLTAQVDLPVDSFAERYGVTLPETTVIGSLTADVEAEGTLQSQTAIARWQLSESSFPGSGELTLADNRVVLDNTRLQVAAGTITAVAVAELENGAWQATANTLQVPLESFTTQMQGLLNANLEAAGNLYALDLITLQARGDATIADARVQLTDTSEPLLPQGDWFTEFEWQGDRLAIANFTAPGIQADGTIGVDFNRSIPIGAIALNVALQEFDLRPLNSFAPETVQEYAQIAGLTSFMGEITGTLDNPQITGNARLVDLAVNQVAFEPLSGPLAFSLVEGGSLDLSGQRDRVRLVVNADPWPVAFEVRNQEFVATGYGEGRQIYADIQQFPLAQLDVQPAAEYGFGTVTGIVDASLEADLRDFRNPVAKGTVTVTEPGLEPIQAAIITADFRYADNTATIEQGELQLDNSRFLLTGQAALQPDLRYEGELSIAEGRIEDLIAIAQKVDLSAFGIGREQVTPSGNAADLTTVPVGLPMASFLEQLETFLAFKEAHPEAPITDGRLARPPVDTLTGGFTGNIAVTGRSLSFEETTVDFKLQGNSWTWGPYAPPNQFWVNGNVNQAKVTLAPVMVNAGETVVKLSGQGNLEQLQGELQVDNLPVELVEVFSTLPVRVAGDLDIMTQFGGSFANPWVEGEVLVAHPQINEQPLAQAGGTFNYRNASLDAEGAVAITPEDAPITLTGQIPYALPFMTVQPTTDQLAVKAIVPSDSFDFVNTLTADQVRWEGGNGEVVVQIGGTLDNPIVAGSASFQDGVIRSAQLGNAITNLTGDVQFNLERVGIQQLQANVGSGTVEVTGQLPLLPSGQSILAPNQGKQTAKPAGEPADGLLISLGALPMDYDGLLRAILDGQIAITGAVLEPTVGGRIEIGEGQVKANHLLRQVGAIKLPTPEELEAINPYRAQFLGIDPLASQPVEQPPGLLDKVTLQDFVVTLSDRLVVSGQPFYNISAEGGITLNGPLSEMQPDGEIALRSGWINLFSTQFRLDTNAPNTATFAPEDGLDPYVDVVLTARVQETDATRVPPSSEGFAGSEISANDVESLGDVEFINVEAIARGYASELQDSLALTSNPPRSQQDLVAMLGSSVAGGLAGTSLTQVAGFLGAGSLAGFGNDLADTLGLRSFSVFPTTDTSAESKVGVGIGMEASFSIGDSIGVNVLEILNSGNPPRLGLQYRFTEQLELQGSSNLDDSEVRLEYRTDL